MEYFYKGLFREMEKFFKGVDARVFSGSPGNLIEKILIGGGKDPLPVGRDDKKSEKLKKFYGNIPFGKGGRMGGYGIEFLCKEESFFLIDGGEDPR